MLLDPLLSKHAVSGASMSPTLRGKRHNRLTARTFIEDQTYTESFSEWTRAVARALRNEDTAPENEEDDSSNRDRMPDSIFVYTALTPFSTPNGAGSSPQNMHFAAETFLPRPLGMLLPRLPIQRGSLIAFRSPNKLGGVAVKRVVALEGDYVRPRAPPTPGSRTVDVDDCEVVPPAEGDEEAREVAERLVREGIRAERLEMLGRSSVSAKRRDPPVVHLQPPLTVPYGHLWVEGDNAPQSVDSNSYGPVSLSLVSGVVVGTWTREEGVCWLRDDGAWEGRLHGRVTRRKDEDDWSGAPVEWAL